MESFELNKFLCPVEYENMTVRVNAADIGGPKPAIFIDSLFRGGGIFKIALHDVRTAQQKLAFFSWRQGLAGA